MPNHVIEEVRYTALDEACYTDATRVDKQFCLPTPFPERVFSSALDDCSRARRLSRGTNRRIQNLANLLTIRWITQCHPQAWIWDERYHFAEVTIADATAHSAQQTFLQMFGEKNLRAIESAAKAAGKMPGYRMKGRPDLATFVPDYEPEWRFIEAKIVKTGDKLLTWQTEWLDIIATALGPDSALELRLVCA